MKKTGHRVWKISDITLWENTTRGPTCRWEDNIKMDLAEIACKRLSTGSQECRESLADMVIKAENFLVTLSNQYFQ
jgi:hypothetical protein